MISVTLARCHKLDKTNHKKLGYKQKNTEVYRHWHPQNNDCVILHPSRDYSHRDANQPSIASGKYRVMSTDGCIKMSLTTLRNMVDEECLYKQFPLQFPKGRCNILLASKTTLYFVMHIRKYITNDANIAV